MKNETPVKERVTMMSDVVGSLQNILDRNILIEFQMRVLLTKIQSSTEQTHLEHDKLSYEEPNFRDFSHKITFLLDRLNCMTEAHAKNLIHLNEIV
jgi:hypothetical protein